MKFNEVVEESFENLWVIEYKYLSEPWQPYLYDEFLGNPYMSRDKALQALFKATEASWDNDDYRYRLVRKKTYFAIYPIKSGG